VRRFGFAAAALLALAACAEGGGAASTGALVTPGLGPTLTPTSGGPVSPSPQPQSSGSISVRTGVQVGLYSNLAVTPPPDAQADAFAVAFLNGLQPRSFAEHREHCGYFLINAAGQISATPPVPGTQASCTQPTPPPNAFASYHTHGAYDAGYDNEVPSPEDMLGDFAFGIDGYISTPGGRVWRVDVSRTAAVQVCTLGCVRVDPGFVPRNEASIPPTMTVQDVAARF